MVLWCKISWYWMGRIAPTSVGLPHGRRPCDAIVSKLRGCWFESTQGWHSDCCSASNSSNSGSIVCHTHRGSWVQAPEEPRVILLLTTVPCHSLQYKVLKYRPLIPHGPPEACELGHDYDSSHKQTQQCSPALARLLTHSHWHLALSQCRNTGILIRRLAQIHLLLPLNPSQGHGGRGGWSQSHPGQFIQSITGPQIEKKTKDLSRSRCYLGV